LLCATRMAKDPLFVERNQMVEIVFRTVGGRFLLRPSQAVNALILAVLARALELFGVQIHAFAFLSNHAHLLISVRDAEMLSGFIGHMKRNIGRGIRRILDWDLNVWAGRTRAIPILDDAAAIARLRYILSHGAKEGLVASPLDWPGVTSARALLGLENLSGVWVDSREACEDRRRRTARGAHTFTRHLPIELTPLPCWADLSKQEYEAKCAALIVEICAEAAANRTAPPLGRDEILVTDPFDKPVAPKLTPAPRAHVSCPVTRNAFNERRRAFLVAYREAAERQKVGLPAVFPPGCYPPRGRFVPFAVTALPPMMPPATVRSGVELAT